MSHKCIIVVLTVIILCDGQLADLFFPNLSKTSRMVLDSLTKTPLVTGPSQTSANLFATAVDSLTRIPAELVNQLGVNLPTLFTNGNNFVDSLDNHIADYNIGLNNDDANLNIRQLITKYGYPFQEHGVVTEDGYVLKLFRIPGKGEPVLLQHGLLGSADDFVIAGPEDGLAYLLANNSYDVWMGNARGNKHSRQHIKFHPSQAAFWDFSWHEIGYYDLPAMIDYILNTTGKTTVKYVGHSQGTTTFFVMASERPDFNCKVSLMIALSPVAFMSHAQSPIVRLMAPGTPFIHSISKSIGMYEFLPDNSLLRSVKFIVCGLGALSDIVCGNILFMTAGVGYTQFNFTNLHVLLGHAPAGASTKQFVHYGQGILTGEFRQFDYGTVGNLERYGVKVPPRYALENIVAPVSLFYSEDDWLAHPHDVDKLYNQISSTIDIHKIPEHQFNHLDFLWAKDFKRLIFDRIIRLFKSFNSTNHC